MKLSSSEVLRKTSECRGHSWINIGPNDYSDVRQMSSQVTVKKGESAREMNQARERSQLKEASQQGEVQLEEGSPQKRSIRRGVYQRSKAGRFLEI